MADPTSHQHSGLRLILMAANTVGVIFAAISGRFMILITLACLLVFILFNGSVFYYQTQGQHSNHFDVSTFGEYARDESTADQVDEGVTRHDEDGGDYTDDHEPKKAQKAIWLILALDILATVGYVTLHILINTSMNSRNMLVFEINMICFLSAILHGFLAYKALMPILTEKGSWKFRNSGTTRQAGTVRI